LAPGLSRGTLHPSSRTVSNMKVLIAADQRKLGMLLEQGLVEAGYAVSAQAVRDGRDRRLFSARFRLDVGTDRRGHLPGRGNAAQIRRMQLRIRGDPLNRTHQQPRRLVLAKMLQHQHQ